MNLREAAQQALEALERDELDMVQDSEAHMVFRKDVAITALRAALKQLCKKEGETNDLPTESP
jgi:hypothetical protein